MRDTSEVANLLRRMILCMDLSPGEILTERWGAAFFSIPRPQIRIVFRKMLSEGLVVRKGLQWTVSPIDIIKVEQLCIYREVLETAAIRISGPRITEEELRALEALFIMAPDTAEGAIDDPGSRFHLQLAGYCHNSFIIEGIRESLLRLSRARVFDRSLGNPAWDDHRKIISALRNKQTDKAAELLSRHLRDSSLRQLRAISMSMEENVETDTPQS